MNNTPAALKLSTWPRRLFAIILLPLMIMGLTLFHADPADAARGGRMGGGSFRAPSMPRSSGGSLGGGYRRGGGGGFGFPFIIPIFGFGGGGLLPLLLLMAVAGVLVNAFRGAGGGQALDGYTPAVPATPSKVKMIQLQVGLLASAKQLQDDLRALAASSDTSSNSGLQRLLQETTLALLRQPDLWVYANSESGDVPFHAAESTFNRLSMNERSKLDAEVTSNVGGQRLNDQSKASSVGEADATNEFIVVTVLVASTATSTLNGTDTSEDLRQSLRILGSTSSSDLLAMEVIWQPEGRGDVLSSEELITAYPNLQHL